MAPGKTIAEVMTKFPHSVGADQPISVARSMMKEHRVRHLPVQEGGQLVGILSDRDVQVALSWRESSEQQFIVRDVSIPEPFTVAPSTPLKDVAATMAKDHIGSALIVDGEKLVGIFTATDACRVLATLA